MTTPEYPGKLTPILEAVQAASELFTSRSRERGWCKTPYLPKESQVAEVNNGKTADGIWLEGPFVSVSN